MTKPQMPRPEPTEGTGYVNYLAPRSKILEIDRLYLTLLDQLGWRYDTVTATWWTPVGVPIQFGRLEYHAEYKWARIQPPTMPDSGPFHLGTRPPPILSLVRRSDGVWEVQP